MEQKYKYLNQFIHDGFIIPDEIIYQEVGIVPSINSVHITIVEQDGYVISLIQGYGVSADKPIELRNIKRVMLNTFTLKDIMGAIKV